MVKKQIQLPYKLLIYDIETELLLAWLFALGEQVIRHTQLVECYDMFGIITISYKWYGEKDVHILTGDDVVEKFDKIARTADVIIGKNNFRFDDKRLNTERLIKGLKPFPEFITRSDDLERQLRRYFAFPSYSLDALSKYFGQGGKEKMEFKDWVDIAKYKLLMKFRDNIGGVISRDAEDAFSKTIFKSSCNTLVKEGKKALKKMGHYNGKDVLDTEVLLSKVLPYVRLKHNAAASNNGQGCVTCGSMSLVPTQIVNAGQTRYQEFECLTHNGYGGRCTFKYNKSRNKVFGKMC